MNVKTTKIISERLLPFLTSKTMLLAMLLCFVVSVHAQAPKTGPNDDFDGDGVVNSKDLDGDNDGILDADESGGSPEDASKFRPIWPSTTADLSMPVGGRAISDKVVARLGGQEYYALVEITGKGGLASDAYVGVQGDGTLTMWKGVPKDNPWFTYSLKFVPKTGYSDALYQNNIPVVGTVIPNVTIIAADIDGSSDGYQEVGAYKSGAGVTGSILSGGHLSPGGFTAGGPGPTYTYYKSDSHGDGSSTGTDKAHWITIVYNSFSEANLVWGMIGSRDEGRGKGSPFIKIANVDTADVDGDNFTNIYDLDSDGDGCSDSNEAYGVVGLADANKQYGNPPGGIAAVPVATPDRTTAPGDPDYDSFNGPEFIPGVPSNGKVVAASYTIKGYAPVITKTAIDQQPVSLQLAKGITDASFSATTIGVSTTAVVKWQQKLSGGTWTDIVNGTINGVTYSIDFDKNLNIANVSPALNNSDYQLVVDDTASFNYVCGPIVSATANLRLAGIAPVANPDKLTVLEDTLIPGTINVVTNTDGKDTDADGTVDEATVDLDPLTPGRQDSFIDPGKGQYKVSLTTGVVTFTPDANYFGTSTVSYTVNDNQGNTSLLPATLTVTITSVNDAPIAVDDNVTDAKEDTLYASAVNLTANDTDVELDVLTAVPGTFTTAKGGKLVLAANGSYTYMPAANFNGKDTVDYTVTDGKLTDIGTLTIDVAPVLDLPEPNDSAAVITKGDPPASLPVIGNVTSVDGPIDLTKIDIVIDLDPSTPAIDNTFTNGEGTYTVKPDGSVTFEPLPTFDGKTTPIDFVIVVTDKTDPTAIPVVSKPAKLSVTVNADADGDGVIDTVEVTDGTNPLDPCSSVPDHATLPKTADFSGCEIVILTGMSPNGDGVYDVFTITNIEKYPNNTLEIYDRWGVVVYEASGYGQPGKLFGGQSEGRSTVSASAQLPVGTYFYALKYVDGVGTSQERSGYLYINR